MANTERTFTYAQNPIELPGNPFWDVFKTFGRDEMLALVINTAGTAGISAITLDPLICSLTGPVVEKIGFFLGHLKEASDIYSTTPMDHRERKLHYVAEALRRGSLSMGKDIAFHDPLYTSSLFFGLQAYPDTPAWMLACLTFGAAVGAVAAGEVVFNEARYQRALFRFKHKGFRLEPYLESRFYIKDGNPRQILTDLSTEFNLGTIKGGQYYDRYFETKLKTYNSRKPMVRFRQREKEDGGHMQTVQIVYTRPSATAQRHPDQFNYYATRKDKLWIELKQKMPWSIGDIEDMNLKNLCSSVTNGQYRDVAFQREVAFDPDKILVAVDQVNTQNSNPLTVVEIKAYQERKMMMIEAMRSVMLNFPVIQTTHSKSMLTT